jgi:hypothetical protein
MVGNKRKVEVMIGTTDEREMQAKANEAWARYNAVHARWMNMVVDRHNPSWIALQCELKTARAEYIAAYQALHPTWIIL